MDDYIKRKDAEMSHCSECSWNGCCLCPCEDVKAILAIPAADVVEVRHGRWIEQPLDFDLCGVAYYQCSECGKEQQTPSNYCQFCGAKMEVGQDEQH